MSTLKIWAFKPNFSDKDRNYLVSLLICLWTWSKYCHIGFSIDDTYYESEMKLGGVVKSPTIRKQGTLLYECDAPPTLSAWADSEVGKPYDLLGLFGFVIGNVENLRDHRTKAFCSEEAVRALHKAGMPFLSNYEEWEVSPAILANFLEALNFFK